MSTRDNYFGVRIHADSIRRGIALALGSVQLLGRQCLELLCLARLNALVPRVLKTRVLRNSAVSEPRTAAAATAHLAGSLDSAALGAYSIGGRCRHCRYSCVKNGQTHEEENLFKLLSTTVV